MSLPNNISSSEQLEPCYILKLLGYYLLFIWLIGTILNGYLSYTFIRYKNLRQSSTNIFIFGLILTDFCGALCVTPLPAVALVECRWIFTYVSCVISAIIAYFTGCSNIYVLCLISIDRYIVLTRMSTTPVISVKHAYISILCVYLLALFWSLLPIIGWSNYDYEGVGASCSVKWEERSLNVTSYNITIFIFVYLIPVIIIIIMNLKSFRVIREQRHRSRINFNESHCQRQYLIECRVTYTIIFIIGGFLLAWSPYAIISIIRAFIYDKYFPPILGTIPALFAKTSVVWNPLVYVVRNGNIYYNLRYSRSYHIKERDKISDTPRHSTQPISTVQLPLTSISSSRD
ncbi:unnamed protein product, partial [Rotaria sp. Silwood2]